MAAYRSFVKPFHLEEPLDYWIFRPVAYTVIQLLQKLPLTPNVFSIFALVFAWSADLAMITGEATLMTMAGIGILCFSVMDCCDGMWARWRGNPYPYGDLVDMFIDLLAAAGHFIALIYLGSVHGNGPYLPLISGIFMFIHASFFHDRKAVWTALSTGAPDERSATVRKYRQELARLNQEKKLPLSRILIRAFLLFSSMQAAERELQPVSGERLEKLKRALPWWGIAAGTTHLSVLALALIFRRPHFYYFYAILVANIFVLIAWFIERD